MVAYLSDKSIHLKLLTQCKKWIYLCHCQLRKFLKHMYGSTGVDYKLKGRLSWLFVSGKFLDDYWSRCKPIRNQAKEEGNLAQVHCTVQSVQKQWGQSSTNIGTSVGIAVGYSQVMTGNEALAQALELQSVTFRQLTCEYWKTVLSYATLRTKNQIK